MGTGDSRGDSQPGTHAGIDAEVAARNAAILTSSLDGFFVIGEDYRFLDVNPAYCRMVGYTRDELLALRISELEAPRARGAGGKPAATDLARTGHHLFCSRVRHRDGHEVELEVSVLTMRSGGRKVLVGFARDVTERNQQEQRLREATQRFQTIVARMPLARVVWDADFTVREWNPAAEAIFGWPAIEAIGRSGFELTFAPGHRATAEKLWRDFLAGRGEGGTYDACRCGGEPLRCEWSNTRLTDDAGRITGVVSYIRDVTERERLERRLAEAQKMESLGVLAGGVAHDFNNFLSGVLCNTRLVLDSLPAESPARVYADRILNAGRRASELTRQMLAYSGRGGFEARPLALADLVSELTDLLRATIPPSVTLSVRLDDRLPAVRADAGQMQQVIMNLVINAAEAIGDKAGVVNVSLFQQELGRADIPRLQSDVALTAGSYVCLEVADNGCGMTPETLERIFDPFFTTKFTGRGLGLAAIRGIIRSHQGAIRVSSEPGVGTVFTVYFPASIELASTQVSAAPPALQPGRTVLVVDDDPEIREVVEDILNHRGIRVVSAHDGPSALAIFGERGDEIDLVLLDMTMPGMGGDAVMREMLAVRPDARIVLSSGYAEREAMKRVREVRPAGFVQKPFTVDGLLETLCRALPPKVTEGPARGDESTIAGQ